MCCVQICICRNDFLLAMFSLAIHDVEKQGGVASGGGAPAGGSGGEGGGAGGQDSASGDKSSGE